MELVLGAVSWLALPILVAGAVQCSTLAQSGEAPSQSASQSLRDAEHSTVSVQLPDGLVPTDESDQLVLEATGTLIPSSTLSAQVAAELAAIRCSFDEVSRIFATPLWSVRSLLLGLDEPTFAKVSDGTYQPWDVANATYGVVKVAVLSTDPAIVALWFSGTYNAPLLAGEYATLPGVKYAEPNYIGGDGSDICLCIDGETHTYVFQTGFGDCMAGCISHTYWGFRVRTELGTTTIETLGSWSTDQGETKPDWLEQLGDCRRFL
jgi:hypothetical protein